jgi:predicted metal-dependent hydrolase
MSIETSHITVGGVKVSIVRKAIKNLHLGVYPPHGRVRVASPLAVSDAAVRLAVVRKLSWIKRQQAAFDAQPRQSEREMVRGESHFFLGRRYRLRVIEHDGVGQVVIRSASKLDLLVRPGTTAQQRAAVLQLWYRNQLKALIPPLLAKWEPLLGVHAADWRVKKMKTRWGTCNIEARRIWLNLELVKKPVQCLEYIVVHELIHLLERHHNARFVALLDKHLPQWRHCRSQLNAAPLAHETWTY